MDDHIKRQIAEFMSELVREERERLGSEVTLYELEILAVEIGDEVTRRLSERGLRQRSGQVATEASHLCPDCGREQPPERDCEPVVPKGVRGTLQYTEPRCHCPTCRRESPDGGPFAATAARSDHAAGIRRGGWPRRSRTIASTST